MSVAGHTVFAFEVSETKSGMTAPDAPGSAPTENRRLRQLCARDHAARIAVHTQRCVGVRDVLVYLGDAVHAGYCTQRREHGVGDRGYRRDRRARADRRHEELVYDRRPRCRARVVLAAVRGDRGDHRERDARDEQRQHEAADRSGIRLAGCRRAGGRR